MSQAVEVTTHNEGAGNVPAIEYVNGEKTKPEPEQPNDVVVSPASDQANDGINGGVVDEGDVEKASEVEPAAAALTEQVVSSPVQESAPPEQSLPVNNEKKLNGNAHPDAGQANCDATGHVKLPEGETVPAKPLDDKGDCVKKPARRASSALSSIVEKTKSTVMYRPRGRSAKRTAAPHGHHQSSNGGCTIF